MAKSPTLIVGLGNPGKKYEHTRHNIGFRVVEALASKRDFPGFTNKGKLSALVAKKGRIILAKPDTFMNRSGYAVQKIAQFYGVESENIWIVHDDKDLPLETLRIRESGGAGGHNGVINIMLMLDTDEFPRIRVGIRNPRSKSRDTAKYVLSPFTTSEEARLKKTIIPTAVDALETALSKGISKAMNQFN